MEIDRFIAELDEYVRQYELCVYPDKQTFDCCDCTICRMDFYNKIRENSNNLSQ